MGNFLNDVLGVTSANKQQAKANMAMQKDAQEFAKWQMKNSHQLEVQDLQNAGINPVLSAGGSGADAGGVSAGSTGAGGGGGIDPITAISSIINTMTNTAKTKADIKNQTDKTQAEVNKLLKDAGYTQKQIDYYNKYGVFPGATTTTKMGGTIGSKLFGISGDATITEPVGLKGGKVNPEKYTGTSAKKYKRAVPDMTHLLYQ